MTGLTGGLRGTWPMKGRLKTASVVLSLNIMSSSHIHARSVSRLQCRCTPGPDPVEFESPFQFYTQGFLQCRAPVSPVAAGRVLVGSAFPPSGSFGEAVGEPVRVMSLPRVVMRVIIAELLSFSLPPPR